TTRASMMRCGARESVRLNSLETRAPTSRRGGAGRFVLPSRSTRLAVPAASCAPRIKLKREDLGNEEAISLAPGRARRRARDELCEPESAGRAGGRGRGGRARRRARQRAEVRPGSAAGSRGSAERPQGQPRQGRLQGRVDGCADGELRHQLAQGCGGSEEGRR